MYKIQYILKVGMHKTDRRHTISNRFNLWCNWFAMLTVFFLFAFISSKSVLISEKNLLSLTYKMFFIVSLKCIFFSYLVFLLSEHCIVLQVNGCIFLSSGRCSLDIFCCWFVHNLNDIHTHIYIYIGTPYLSFPGCSPRASLLYYLDNMLCIGANRDLLKLSICELCIQNSKRCRLYTDAMCMVLLFHFWLLLIYMLLDGIGHTTR